MSLPAFGTTAAWERWAGRLISHAWLDAPKLRLALIIFGALGATYVAVCIKTVAIGASLYGFADFHALWVSGVLAHDGTPLVNYDGAALHAEQVRLGIDPRHENPFPYPPIFLLLLAPLGALPLAAAYWIFMGVSGVLFVAAMVAGRARHPIWWLASLSAPASGITIVSGQSGFLSAALMIGGLRLASSRPWISGLLFGLLTFKPQLGVLVPVALLAAGLWRVAAAACIAALAGVAASSLAFGFGVWPAWWHQLTSYTQGYDVVVDLMPTIFANVRAVVAAPMPALVAQLVVALVVCVVVWRAFRAGVTERGIGLVVVGTFLATPHAFNYDMPMTSAAIAAYLLIKMRDAPRMSILEVAVVVAAFVAPLAILAGRGALAPWSWVPGAALFALLAAIEPARTPEPSSP